MLAIATTQPLWTSIALSLAPVVVALIAIVLGAKQQAKTLNEQRRQEDLRAARDLLDEAARGLSDADHRRRGLIRNLDDDYAAASLNDSGKTLDEPDARLAIHFGRGHQVRVTFHECVEAVLNLSMIARNRQPEHNAMALAKDQFESTGTKFETQLWPAFTDAAVAYAGLGQAAKSPDVAQSVAQPGP